MTTWFSAPRYARPLTPPRQSLFLCGMRGLGKSTWAQQWHRGLPVAPLLEILEKGDL